MGTHALWTDHPANFPHMVHILHLILCRSRPQLHWAEDPDSKLGLLAAPPHCREPLCLVLVPKTPDRVLTRGGPFRNTFYVLLTCRLEPGCVVPWDLDLWVSLPLGVEVEDPYGAGTVDHKSRVVHLCPSLIMMKCFPPRGRLSTAVGEQRPNHFGRPLI